MRAISAVLLTAVVALAPAAAQAQDRKWVAEAAVGPTMVFGAAGDNLGTGFNFQAGATYKVTPRYGFKIDTLISKHDVNDSITQALGVGDGVNFQLNHDAAVFVESRYNYVRGEKPPATVNPLTGSPT